MAEKLILQDTYLGVEIEIERAQKLPRTFKHWAVKPDNSLREGGLELVFPVPYKAPSAELAIEEAYEHLIKLPKKSISPRTGIHVHMDVRDMDINALRKMCIFYAMTEEALFDWVGNFRHLNSYCMPWYEAQGDIPRIARMLTKKKTDIKKQAAGLGRYSALNLNAIHKFGSVEARHLLTTFDKEALYTWINLLLCLKKCAVASDTQPMEIIEYFEARGSLAFMRRVFGPYARELNSKKINLGPHVARDILSQEGEESMGTFYAHLVKKGEPEGYDKFLKQKGLK